ncbi:MAG: hypothetical protein IJP89_04770 [Synergistaceae bacterium]|nr:hypothetical protein [Synergistaceae bacterium]
MAHRGRKLDELNRQMRKKSLLDERDARPQRHRGGGGWRTRVKTPGGYYWNYTGEEPAELTAEAEEMLRQAAYCESYSPETAEYFRTQAEDLKTEAAELVAWEREDTISRRRRNWRERRSHWNCWRHCFFHPFMPPQRKAQHLSFPPVLWGYDRYSRYWYFSNYRTAWSQSWEYSYFRRSVADRTRDINFMGGVSYRMVTPLDTLKLISAGSIFGEPMYYREGDNEAPDNFDSIYGIGWENDARIMYYDDTRRKKKHLRAEDEYFQRMALYFSRLTASQVMEKVIDDSLEFDFEGTLKWAVELRTRFLMRLNPQVIIVRASVHKNRPDFTRQNPGKFQDYAQRIMTRGDDVIHQLEYWLSVRGSKKGIPPVLKRSWARNIGSMDAYSMSKYANAGTGLIDTVRICHAKGPIVDTLMRTGKVPMPEGENTWERLRASGMSWQEILRTIKMPHMALLRNLRGIFREVKDEETLSDALELLKRGVRGGKQFPFRYYRAWKIFEDEKDSWLWDVIERAFPWHDRVQAALEECITISCENLPEIPGRSAFLTDNSGSAWDTHTSEHGSVSMAEIGNLSSVIGAIRSEKGTVYAFGNKLSAVPISREGGVLEQARLVNSIGMECGMSTESGLYAFFRDAVCQKQHWDNIFIYSDMQTSSKPTFGISPAAFKKMGAWRGRGRIDINEVVREYRERVNPWLNVVCVQTAGYTNAVMPEYGYRSSILCGWTGKELLFADEVRRFWDDIEQRRGSHFEILDTEKVNVRGF